MRIRRRSFVAGSGLALLLAGCSSPPARYYQLAVAPGTVLTGGPPVVRVRSVSIPGYLNQNGIAKPAANYQFGVYDNDLWAEPLADMLQAVLVQDLAQRLGQSNVLASSGAIGAPADMLVEVNLLRFDPDAAGKVFLNAQIAVRTSQGAAWTSAAISPSAAPAGPDVPNTVAAMSQLWGMAADQTARMLVDGWAMRPPATAT